MGWKVGYRNKSQHCYSHPVRSESPEHHFSLKVVVLLVQTTDRITDSAGNHGCKLSELLTEGDHGCKLSELLTEGDHGCKLSELLTEGDHGCKLSELLTEGDYGCKLSKLLAVTQRVITGVNCPNY